MGGGVERLVEVQLSVRGRRVGRNAHIPLEFRLIMGTNYWILTSTWSRFTLSFIVRSMFLLFEHQLFVPVL